MSAETTSPPSEEQKRVPENETDTAPQVPDLEEVNQPEPEPKQDDEPKGDPRESMMDRLAQERVSKAADEYTRLNTVPEPEGGEGDGGPKEGDSADPEKAEPSGEGVSGDDEPMTLKVRRQEVNISRKQRDELAKDYLGDDIGDLTEAERNKYARLNLADQSYERERQEKLAAIKGQDPEPQRQEQPTEQATQEPKADDPITKAEAKIKDGVDRLQKAETDDEVAAARKIIDEGNAEKVRAFVREELSEQNAKTQEERINRAYETDISEGFNALSQDAAESGVDFQDPVMRSTVSGLATSMQAEIIARHVEGIEDANLRNAFMSAGFTRENLQRTPPEQIPGVYKDMLKKGYKLPPPSAAIRAAGQAIRDRFAAPPQTDNPDGAPQHTGDGQNKPEVAVNRSERKQGLQNRPDRATIPRAGHSRQPPDPTQTRKAALSEEMKARRSGAPTGR